MPVSFQAYLLHCAVIEYNGEGYAFAAKSGTGKSTHTRLWRELFGERAIMVNDDKPFLQITSSGVFAYGSPWSGKHGLATNVRVPLEGVCFAGEVRIVFIELMRIVPLLPFAIRCILLWMRR